MIDLLHLDLCVDTSGEGEVLEALNRLGGGTEDINQTFVDFHFESFAASFVDVWRLYHCKSAALGWQRDWTRHAGASTNCRINNLAGALVDDAVVIGLEADADG